jgi:hypothetical protein
MNQLYEAALNVQRFCETHSWRFCIIGGVAVQRWGEIRFTRDVDLSLFTGFGDEERYVHEWLKGFQLRPPGTAEMARRARVLLLTDTRGIPVDVALGALPFEERAIQRSSLWEIPDGGGLRTCSAEDLVVHKCFANRERDWPDVEAILARQGRRLDLALVRNELRPLAELKEAPEILDRLERAISRRDRPFTRIPPPSGAP